MQKLRLVQTLFERGLRVSEVLFAPDGSTLATTGGYRGNAIRLWCLWDTETWELLQVLRRPNTAGFSTIAFSFCSDKEMFISGAWSHEDVCDTRGNILGWNVTHKGLVQFWDLRSGTLSDCIEAHTDTLCCLAYEQKEDLLATGGADGVVKIWSVKPK